MTNTTKDSDGEMATDADPVATGSVRSQSSTPEVFISYASDDRVVADSVCTALEREGVACWIAPRDVTPGNIYSEAIVHAIDTAKVVVLVLSQNAAVSQHVLREVERASSKRHPLVSFRIDLAPVPAALEYFLNTSQWLDASATGVERALPKLVDAVQRCIAQVSSPAIDQPTSTLSGDGVNVAARLQALATAGDILISGRVYEQVKRRVRSWRAAAVSILVLLAAGALWWLGREGIPWLLPPLLTTGEVPAVAVLPFSDLSEDQTNTSFCDGLTEELLNSLAQLPNLRVVARTSAFMFRDPERDVRDIGRQLRVTHVLVGSVRRSGERVRIIAQLANTHTGYNDWSDRFDLPFTDSLDIQQEIALAVVTAMQVKLTPEDEIRLAEPRASDMQAYESYLLGRYHQYQRTPESLAKAIAYQRQAIDRDPAFALAYAGLADAHMAEYYYANRAIEDVEASVVPLVERALGLDPRLPEAYAARGTLRTEQMRLEEAEADLRRTVALNPNSADGYVRLGAALEYAGRPREALANLARAVDLDPLHFILHIRICLVRQNVGQYEEAKQACNRALELRPNLSNAHWGMALNALAQGELKGAVNGYDAALEQNPQRVDLLLELAWVYLDLGLIENARERFDQAINASSPDPLYARVEKSFWFVATREQAALAVQLRDELVEGSTDIDVVLDLGLLSLLAGDLQSAKRFATHGLDLAAATPQALRNPYRIRWGRSSPLTLAIIALRGGDSAGAAERLTALMNHLDDLERAGHVWHGLEYLRASMHALREDPHAALAALERAYQLGWRRAWWMRVDPAFAGMRDDPAFTGLITRIEHENAATRRSSLAVQGNPAASRPSRSDP